MSAHLTSRPVRLILAITAPLLLGASVLAGAVAFRSAPHSAHAAGNGAAALPAHFSFGIMDGPGDTPWLDSMRSTNGTAWDYRYQYLAGGVNTGSGWSTWNQPAGAFARFYLQDSAAHGYLPALVYYNLLQSNGPSGGSEPANDLAHLASPATMRAYYADWALLMQQVGAFGKPALVIVEPDLWGFIEQAAVQAAVQAGSTGSTGTASAASVPASVASSGAADAAGYANTAQGFAYTLLHIRDRYAPHAILALHASAWGTGIDIASDTRTSLDAAAIGAQTARFLQTAGLSGTPAGVSTFDVVSNDIADHDAGQSGIWWDRTNQTYPNFSRYLQYASALSAQTGRRLLLWQVPVGNQYFDTEDNSRGHTQDNKAEYILGHVADFAHAGVSGVLFGPGNGGTAVQDARHDGVTNPAPISTYECTRCNSHTSSYADDDGGYLRLFVGQYYRNGAYPLGSGGTPPPTSSPSPSSSPPPSSSPTGCAAPKVTFGSGSVTPATVAPGATATVSITLTASCQSTGLVDFQIYNAAGNKVWQSWQDNVSLSGSAQTFTARWSVPASQAAGTYTLKIGVFNPGWGTLYAWDNAAATLTIA